MSMNAAKKIRIGLQALKYFPIITALIMLLHVSALVFDRATPTSTAIVENVFSMPAAPTIGTMILSKHFGFCSLHRCLIGYSCGVTYCMIHQSSIGFGEYLDFMRIIMLVIGISLGIWLGVKTYKQKIQGCVSLS